MTVRDDQAPHRALRIVLSSSAGMLALLLFAFIAAPYSCDGGLAAYFWVGVVAVLGLSGLVWFLAKGLPFDHRFLVSVGVAIVTIATWVGGFLVANFQIICRLF
jgi:hypothetical protein